jgi:hypothetical protein
VAYRVNEEQRVLYKVDVENRNDLLSSPDVGLVASVVETVDTIDVNRPSNVCHLALNCCWNVRSLCKLLSVEGLVQFGDHITVTWTDVRRRRRLL